MSRVRTTAAVLLLFVLHVTIFANVRPFGVAPDVMLLGALAGAMVGSADYGAKHGFVCGLLVDLMSPGPFGLAAGVYGAVGHGVGLFSQPFDSQDLRVGPIATVVGSFIGTVGYGLGLGVLGQEQFVEWRLVFVAAMVALYNLIMFVPVQRLYLWVASAESSYVRTTAADSVVN